MFSASNNRFVASSRLEEDAIISPSFSLDLEGKICCRYPVHSVLSAHSVLWVLSVISVISALTAVSVPTELSLRKKMTACYCTNNNNDCELIRSTE